MTDQCKPCELRGDIEKCLAADCFQHENWYAIKQQALLKEAREDIQRLERAVSVLTGSNPDWRTKVSKGDKEIIEGMVGTMWKGWVSDEWL